MTHIPTRECICCRQKAPKADMLRMVQTENGIVADEGGKHPGRGAYLCRTCRENPVSLKKRPLDRAFRQKVADEVYRAIFADAVHLAKTE